VPFSFISFLFIIAPVFRELSFILYPNFYFMDQQNDPGFSHDIAQDMYVDPVPPGIRFANFMIDRIVMLALVFAITFVWAAIAYSRGQNIQDSILMQDTLPAKLIDYVVTQLLTILYYTIAEAATKGRTPGKMVTGTIVITEDGRPFTFKDALLRSICRVIPFEPFSAFGYRPWHDSLSKTAVVKKTW
jgi:uncharacterized RDD family membrane protein YckC